MFWCCSTEVRFTEALSKGATNCPKTSIFWDFMAFGPVGQSFVYDIWFKSQIFELI